MPTDICRGCDDPDCVDCVTWVTAVEDMMLAEAADQEQARVMEVCEAEEW